MADTFFFKLPNYPSPPPCTPTTVSINSFSKSVSLFLFCKFICITFFFLGSAMSYNICLSLFNLDFPWDDSV